MSGPAKTNGLAVGVRFTVDELPELPAVEIIGNTPTAWKITEIAPDGTLSRASYRIRKAGLIGKTIRIVPPGPLPVGLVPAALPTAPAPEIIQSTERLLTKAEFQKLQDVPPEAEWFANIQNANTRRAYQNDLRSFMRFVGIEKAQEFRTVTRAHVIAWRKELEKQSLAPATIRRKLGALRSVRSPLRLERHHAQPGERRRASQGRRKRGQDPCPLRCPSQAAFGCSTRIAHHQKW
jgi:hypothetical protein